LSILQIHINGFRNLKTQSINLNQDDELHLLTGENGQGKTNLLEAIYLCALSKSFRSHKNVDLIGFESDFTSVKIIGDEQSTLEVILTRKPAQKVLKKNGVKQSAINIVGELSCVFFSPDDLSNMAHSPKLRRRYLDVFISQFDRNYLAALMQYEAARKQRNALLKQIREKKADSSQLNFWNQCLAQHGQGIHQKRKEIIHDLNQKTLEHYQAISQKKDNLRVQYNSKVESIKSKNEYLKQFEKEQDTDILLGKTQFGPHRDDLEFFLNEQDMQRFSSRGEWRSLVLAMKFSELELLEEKTQKKPILLLDDVLSELDEKRKDYLIKAIKGFQTFLTTTHFESNPVHEKRVQWFEVVDGAIKEKSINAELTTNKSPSKS